MVEKHTDKILIVIVVAIIALLSIRDSRGQVTTVADLETDEEYIEAGEIGGDIVVHITGEVMKPDVYEVEDGSRLDDLVVMAGGFTDKANDQGINLALRLEDEMMVRIPSVDDEDYNSLESGILTITDQSMSDKVNINTASSEDLQSLSGIGPKTAEKIIEYREDNKFKNEEDIMNVNGIGEKTYEDIKDQIRVR